MVGNTSVILLVPDLSGSSLSGMRVSNSFVIIAERKRKNFDSDLSGIDSDFIVYLFGRIENMRDENNFR